MQALIPYLMFDGNCEEAMQFYIKCFDGELGYIGRFVDSPVPVPDEFRQKIMHVEFKFWAGSLMASDHVPGAGYTTQATGSNIHLSLAYSDPGKMESDFNHLREGGRITMPLQDTFWGDRFGMVRDKFGINWMFSCNMGKSETKS